LTVNANGTFDYDPNGQFETLAVTESTTDSFSYTIADGNGGTDTATATITINGVNDAPVAQDDNLSTDEDTVFSGNVLSDNGNGADSDIDTSDTLVVSAVNGVAASVGAEITLASGALLTVNAIGGFDYDPNGQFETLAVTESTTDSFEYTIADGNGGTDTATATITINGVNDVPVAQDDSLSTNEDTAFSGNVLSDNGNGADSDIDTSDTLAVSAVNGVAASVGTEITLASGALLTVNTIGTFDYDPNGQFETLAVTESTTDSFEYTIADGNGGTDTATATITINGVNDAPVAQDDSLSTDEDTAFSGNVLSDNGNGADSDIDTSDSLAVSAVNGVAASVDSEITLTSGALLIVNVNGTFDYDPNGVFEGLNTGDSSSDSFEYTITDSQGGISTATATININGVTDSLPNIRLGDAPTRLSRANRKAWEDAWTDDELTVSHKANFTDDAEAYSSLSYKSSGSGSLSGGDVFRGDLGVSGQTELTSPARQEIDGTEALKFELNNEAFELTFGLSHFYADDDNTGFSEAGRVLLLDENDNVVKNVAFTADSNTGEQEITVDASEGFTQVIFNAGSEDQEFVFGAYTNTTDGSVVSPFGDATSTHGSDYLLDFMEISFELPVFGVLDENNDA